MIRKQFDTKINVISAYVLFSTLFGVLGYSSRKYTRDLPTHITHAGDKEIFFKYKIGHTGEALFSDKLFDGFYTPTKKFLSEEKMPIKTSPGLVYGVIDRLKSTSDNNASFRKHYLDLFALSPLKILSLPTGLTHQMAVDTYETSDENLE